MKSCCLNFLLQSWVFFCFCFCLWFGRVRFFTKIWRERKYLLANKKKHIKQLWALLIAFFVLFLQLLKTKKTKSLEQKSKADGRFFILFLICYEQFSLMWYDWCSTFPLFIESIQQQNSGANCLHLKNLNYHIFTCFWFCVCAALVYGVLKVDNLLPTVIFLILLFTVQSDRRLCFSDNSERFFFYAWWKTCVSKQDSGHKFGW